MDGRLHILSRVDAGMEMRAAVFLSWDNEAEDITTYIQTRGKGKVNVAYAHGKVDVGTRNVRIHEYIQDGCMS